MGKSNPTPPAAPDAATTAAAQTASNEATAAAQQKLNMVNSSGPQGTVTYAADPSAPGGYSQTTTLSPQQQGIYDQAAGAESQAIGNVNTALGTTINPSNYGALTTNVSAGPIQSTFAPGQAVQGQVGSQDINASVQNASDSAYNQATSRLDPQWAKSQEQTQTALANQGLNENSAAWQNAMNTFNQAKNDAYSSASNDATQLGDAEQQQLYGQQLDSGQFANAAAGQEYSQNQGTAAFSNNAQNQTFNEGQANATLNNQAQNQGFTQAVTAQELPIQEFTALEGGGQIASPQGISYTPTQVAPTDYLGAQALQTNTQQANYKTQMAQQQAGLSGLFSLGSAAMTAFA